MTTLLSIDRAKEYLSIVTLVVLMFILGILSTLMEDDITLLACTGGFVLLSLYYLRAIEPVHLFYSLCLGVSFLPYINLQLFPLSAVYVIAMLFIGVSFISFVRSNKPINISPQAKWMAALLGIGIISMIAAPDKKAAFIYVGQFFLYICVYVATVNILDKKSKIVQAIRYVIYGSVITVLISVIQFIVSLSSLERVIDLFFESMIGKLFIGINGLERIGDSAAVILNRGSNISESSDLVLFRVFGTFEGPTIFGWYLLIIGLLVGGLFILQFKKRRVGLSLYSIAPLFVLVTIFLSLTWTRSAILAFVLAFLFLVIYRNRTNVQFITAKRVKIFSGVMVFLALFGFMLWLLQVPLPMHYLIAIFNVKNLGGSTVGRLLTIFFALSYIVQNPLIGIGMGNYKYVQPGVDASSGTASFASAHNTYLEVGVELGLPGLIIFVLLIRSFLNQAAVLTKAAAGSFYHTLGITFISIWIGFAIVSFFGGNLIHPRFMTLLWILAGIQTASYHLFLNDKKKENTVYRLQVAD